MTLALHGYPDWQNPLATADLSSLQTNPTIGIFSNFNSTIIDMRAFNSYALRINAATVAAGVAFNECRVTVLFGDDAALTNITYLEVFSIFTDGNGSVGFPSTNGRLNIQDAVHGPFMRVTVDNNSVQSISASIEILGHSRTIARRYVGNESSNGSFNVDNLSSQLLSVSGAGLGAGAFVDHLLRMAPGPVTVNILGNPGALQVAFFLPSGTQFFFFNTVGGTNFITPMNFPRTAVRLRVTDISGAGNSYYAYVTSGRENW